MENNLSEERKKFIVEAKLRGERDVDVANRFHVTQSCVSKIFKKRREQGTVKRKKVSGRPRKTTPGQARLLVRQAKKDPFMIAVGVRKYAEDHLGVVMTDRTSRNI